MAPRGVTRAPANFLAFTRLYYDRGNYREVSSYRQLSSALPVPGVALETGIHRRRLGEGRVATGGVENRVAPRAAPSSRVS